MEKNNRLFLQQAKKEKHIVKQRTFEFIKKKQLFHLPKTKLHLFLIIIM